MRPAANRLLAAAANLSDQRRSGEEELFDTTSVDLAQLLVLVDGGLLERHQASALAVTILDLRRNRFEEVLARPAPRGRYLAYEDHLIELVGMDVAGRIHTGRSRNDLKATVQKLAARRSASLAADAIVDLIVVLTRRAERYADVTMPLHTHHQPAVPTTLGHYYAAVARALLRPLAGASTVLEDIDTCPLGAAAGGGTSVTVDHRRAAYLLGFVRPTSNSIDAVASRDYLLIGLAHIAVTAITASRLGRDLEAWTGPEFGFLELPDDLTGSSSAMPQKRNAFLLEHVHGLTGRVIGGLGGTFAATHATPFTNSIAVGTEAMAELERVVAMAVTALGLLRMHVASATPVRDRMLRSAEDGHTTAMLLAERLVEEGVPFRAAHHRVGELVVEALRIGASLQEVAVGSADTAAAATDLTVAGAVAAVGYGAGPTEGTPTDLRDALVKATSPGLASRTRWAAAERTLEAAIADLISAEVA